MGTQKETGFGGRGSKEWTKYEDFRPTYPPSFFEKIYEYHGQKSGAQWEKAIDVGAGAGIVSGPLADRFQKVIVADPSKGYVSIARQGLVEELGLPEASFEFLQESAEKSSLPLGSVDLVSACTCLHWADIPASVQEFYRILRPGGTVFIAKYSKPRIAGNPLANDVWTKLFHVKTSKRPSVRISGSVASACSGLTDVELPEDKWIDVKRIWINTDGSLDTFDYIGEGRLPDKTGPNDQLVWLENDEEWSHTRDFASLQGFEQTFEPVLSTEELQEHWDQLEKALGGREKEVRTQTPVAMVFARKK